jgi:hypothetical protein
MPKEEDGFAAMTAEHAAFVRELRVSRGRTWRWVAEECAMAWGGSWDSEQFLGKKICERAAELLGEDPNRDPWN